jgi:putative spermidine/putrescine transport system substrate-binding protein
MTQRAVGASALALVVGTLAFLVAGCGGRVTDWQLDGLGGSLSEIQRGARQEGQVDLLLRRGFTVPSWTRAFTEQTGCTITTQTATSTGDLVERSSSGGWDGVLAMSDVTRRLIDEGDVAPVNPGLVPGYADIYDSLKRQPFDTVEKTGYGVPQGRVPNLEVFRTDLLPAGLDSSEPMWLAYFKGSRSIYDDPIFIADAAVYLAATRPGLHITNPYELDERQFPAVVAFLRRYRPTRAELWTAATVPKQLAAFSSGQAAIGTSWPRQVRTLETADPPVPVTAIAPKEGLTGWADTWMISAHADHPNCTYLWLDYVISSEANAKIAEQFDEAPANERACVLMSDDTLCSELHADDEEWWSNVRLWTTPEKDCGDARGDACKTYDDWRSAWTQLLTRARPAS